MKNVITALVLGVSSIFTVYMFHGQRQINAEVILTVHNQTAAIKTHAEMLEGLQGRVKDDFQRWVKNTVELDNMGAELKRREVEQAKLVASINHMLSMKYMQYMPTVPADFLLCSGRLQMDYGGGSGGRCSVFAIDKRRLIGAGHCAAHILVGADVTFCDAEGREVRKLKVHLVSAAPPPDCDLSLWETDEDMPVFHPIEYGEAKPNTWGFTLSACGGHSPYHITWGVFAGEVDGIDGQPHVFGEMATACGPGSSGSSVFNYDSKFVGILVRGGEGAIYFVPGSVVKVWLDGVGKATVEVKK